MRGRPKSEFGRDESKFMIESYGFLIARSELKRRLSCVVMVMSVNHCFENNTLIIGFESLYLQKKFEKAANNGQNS